MNEDRINMHVAMITGMLGWLPEDEKSEVLERTLDRMGTPERYRYSYSVKISPELAAGLNRGAEKFREFEALVEEHCTLEVPDPDAPPWELAWRLAWAEIAGAHARRTFGHYEKKERGFGFSGDRAELVAYLAHQERVSARELAAVKTEIDKWREERESTR